MKRLAVVLREIEEQVESRDKVGDHCDHSDCESDLDDGGSKVLAELRC